MRNKALSTFILSLACLFTLAASSSMARTVRADSAAQAKPQPTQSVTHHSVRIDGKKIDYTATAGTLILRNDKDEPIARFGYIAYTRDGVDALGKRPVTFAYNGGPGSSSLWLHMGALGPKRVVVKDPEVTPPAPYNLEDNQYSLLDVSDVVMIDPVGTGFSKALGKSKDADFWGVDEDIKSVSQFIKQYVSRNNRYNSPKFLLGESYGTMRSAGVVDYLQQRMGISMNGVVLVSSVLDLPTITFGDGDDRSYVFYLPTYAAVAWYHDALDNKPADLKPFLDEVRDFARGEYAQALLKGDELGSTERQKIVDKLHEYTGLSKDYIEKANLRVKGPQFSKELMREQHKTVGRLDARYDGNSMDLLGEYARYDPQSSAISPAYISSFMHYLHNELDFGRGETYHVSGSGTFGKWNWRHRKNGGGFPSGPNTAVDLREAMMKNPYLKVMVLNGYYDLATPFFATEYTMSHMNLEKDLQSNIIMKYFEAGHMMYVKEESLAQMKKAVAGFITETAK